MYAIAFNGSQVITKLFTLETQTLLQKYKIEWLQQ
jgi:hypothetical protein